MGKKIWHFCAGRRDNQVSRKETEKMKKLKAWPEGELSLSLSSVEDEQTGVNLPSKKRERESEGGGDSERVEFDFFAESGEEGDWSVDNELFQSALEREPDNDGVDAVGSEFQGALTEAEIEAVREIQQEGYVDTVIDPQAEETMIRMFNESSNDFVIKESKYGKGLFAKRGFKKDEPLMVAYPGVKVKSETGEKLPKSYDKLMSLNAKETLVGNLQKPGRFSPLPYINDPGYTKLLGNEVITPAQNANVVNYMVGDQVFFKATRKINPGDELQFFYGYDFWAENREYFPNEKEYKNAMRQVERNKKEQTRKARFFK